jgi:hypothetical protein
MEPVVIRACRDVQEAHIVRSMLAAGGVQAFIPDEQTASLMPPNFLHTDGVRVLVAAKDAALARELLAREPLAPE